MATVASTKVKAGKKAAAKVRETLEKATTRGGAKVRATATPAEPTAVVGKASNGGSGYTSGSATVAVTTADVPAARARPTAGERGTKRTAETFKMAGEVTRLRVLTLLAAGGGSNVGDMARAFKLGQPALSHHLALLRHADLIEPVREGKARVYSLTPRGAILARLASELRTAD